VPLFGTVPSASPLELAEVGLLRLWGKLAHLGDTTAIKRLLRKHTMSTESPATLRLLHAFSCSIDDLVANRHGLLTPAQQHRIAQYIAIGSWSSRLALFVFLGSVAFFFIGAPFLMQEETIPRQILPYLVGTALVVLALVGVFVGIGLRRVQTLRRAQIREIEGTVRRTTKQFRHGRWTAYYLWVGPMRFQLTSEQQYKVFVEGSTYRIYYIHYPPTHVIMSLEVVAGASHENVISGR
jgi:hypothetical protein